MAAWRGPLARFGEQPMPARGGGPNARLWADRGRRHPTLTPTVAAFVALAAPQAGTRRRHRRSQRLPLRHQRGYWPVATVVCLGQPSDQAVAATARRWLDRMAGVDVGFVALRGKLEWLAEDLERFWQAARHAPPIVRPGVCRELHWAPMVLVLRPCGCGYQPLAHWLARARW